MKLIIVNLYKILVVWGGISFFSTPTLAQAGDGMDSCLYNESLFRALDKRKDAVFITRHMNSLSRFIIVPLESYDDVSVETDALSIVLYSVQEAQIIKYIKYNSGTLLDLIQGPREILLNCNLSSKFRKISGDKNFVTAEINYGDGSVVKLFSKNGDFKNMDIAEINVLVAVSNSPFAPDAFLHKFLNKKAVVDANIYSSNRWVKSLTSSYEFGWKYKMPSSIHPDIEFSFKTADLDLYGKKYFALYLSAR